MRYFLCFVSVLLVFSSKAEDLYASSADEVNRLCTIAKAGDRVILKAGTYTNAVIAFSNKNGNAEKPVMLIAASPGKVFFEGNSTLSFSGNNIIVEGFVWQNGGKELGTKSVIEIKASHSVLQDCALLDYNNSDFATDNKWISVYGQYNVVRRCLIKDKRNLGATLTVWLKDKEPAYHTISHNYFLNRINGPNEGNGLESIRIGDSKTSFTNAHCVVAFNRFENCDGEIEIISNKSCHNSYLHNTFFNNDGGLTLRHGNDCLVDGNFFDGGDKKKSYGVRVIGEGHTVINNYFFNLKGAQRKGSEDQFRAPLTVVNGLENTPINGYFQVRRAVLQSNVFVNNVTPNIRLGARSKREGMTNAPDTVAVIGNLMFDDNCSGSEVYEDLVSSGNVYMLGNKIVGKCLSAPKKSFDRYPSGKRDGFLKITDNAGNLLVAADDKTIAEKNPDAGSGWVHPSIHELVQKKKYSIMSATEVGPSWLK